MIEATKIRLRERKSQPRKSWFRPAKTEKGKWLRFYCCLAAVALVLFIAFFGKYFAPYDPLATDYAAKLSAPGGSQQAMAAVFCADGIRWWIHGDIFEACLIPVRKDRGMAEC